MKESSLVDWAKDCNSLRELFGKARIEGMQLNIGDAAQYAQFFTVVEEKEDYAIVSHHEPRSVDGPEMTQVFIHGYGSSIVYWVGR